jgi:hypothetical protein
MEAARLEMELPDVVGLFTVTLTAELVVEFPAASLAIASNVCDPLLVLAVSHEYV